MITLFTECIIILILFLAPQTEGSQEHSSEWKLQEANLLFRQGRTEQALKLYSEVLTENPNEVSAFHMAGYILNRAGDFHEAEDCFQRALLLDGNDKYSLQMLGNIYLELFRPTEAKKYYLRALKLDSNDEILKENLTLANEKINRARLLARRYKRSTFLFWGGIGIGFLLLLVTIYLEIKDNLSS